MEAEQRWDTGLPPAALPIPQRVGSATCIANGALFAQALAPDQRDDGYPLACYIPAVPLDPFWHHSASIWHCDVQLFYARAIAMLYEGEAGPLIIFAERFFGQGAVASYHAGTASLPAVLVVTTPTFSACIASGTENYQQLALQAFYSLAGPQSYGLFSTSPQWYVASDWIHSCLMADGVPGNKPIVFAGHSYGAAAVSVLIARYRVASAARRIRYLTFGSPKPGDLRLTNLLRQTQGIDFSNTADFVTVLPPDTALLNPVYISLGLPILLNWTTWSYPPNITLQESTGQIQINKVPTLDSFTLLQFTQRALLDLQLDQFPTHAIDVYVDRIGRRCQGMPMPAIGQLGLGLPKLATRGNLGLRGLSPFPFGQLGLGAQVVAAAGQLGIGFNGIDGQLGLGDLPAIAAGQLGLGAQVVAAAGQLGIGFNGIDGQLGLGAQDLAGGQLGLSAQDLAAGQLGLKSDYSVSEGSLGLKEGLNPTVDYWLDTFQDTDGTPLASHTGELTPGGYTQVFGSAAIQSNLLENASTFYLATFDPGQTTYNAKFSLQWDINTTSVSVLFRYNNAFSTWQVLISLSSGIASGFTLQCLGGSSFSGFGTVTLTLGNTYDIVLVVTPTDVSCTIEGVNVSTTDSSHASATLFGIRTNSSSSSNSNFWHEIHVHS